jgi:hypothetical protein
MGHGTWENKQKRERGNRKWEERGEGGRGEQGQTGTGETGQNGMASSVDDQHGALQQKSEGQENTKPKQQRVKRLVLKSCFWRMT